MRKYLYIAALFILGCTPPTYYKYKVKLFTPEGKYHQAYIVKSAEKPYYTHSFESSYVYYGEKHRYYRMAIPDGWFVEISKEN